MRRLAVALVALASVGANAAPVEEPTADMARELAGIEQQSRALDLVRGRFLVSTRRNDARSRERAHIVLWQAQTHLLLGDTARALDLAVAAQSDVSPETALLQVSFLKIQYESERKLGRLAAATATCQRFLLSGSRDDAWFLSCAQLLARRASEEPNAVREPLSTWATAPALRRGNPFLVPTSLVLAGALETLGRRTDAQTLLARTLGAAEKNDVWLPRARYALALFDLHQGEESAGLLTLREIARASAPRDPAIQPADVTTVTLAQVALARWYESHGNAAEATKFFKSALANVKARVIPATPPPEKAGVIAPAKTLSLAPEKNQGFDLVELRSEYASHLCAKGEVEACARELDALSHELPDRPVAEVLARSKVLRAQGLQRLAKLTGYAQTDAAFVARQQEMLVPLGIDELSARAAALLSIARTYGSQNPSLDALSNLEAIPRRLRASTLEARSHLASVLQTPEELLDAGRSSASQMAQTTLEALSQRLWNVVRELDALSQQHWNEKGRDSATEKTRLALLARAEALFDATSRRQTALEQGPARESLRSLQADMSKAGQDMNLTRSRAASIGVLLSLTQKESKGELWWREAQRARFDLLTTLDLDAATLAAARLDYRLTLLQADLPNNQAALRDRNLPRSQKTLEELAAVHHRQLAKDAPRLEALWQQVVAAHKTLVESAAAFRRFDTDERKRLAGEAQILIKDFELLERRGLVLAEGYRKELQSLIPQVAHSLTPAVVRFRDELRLALADADGDALRSTDEARQLLDHAARERQIWIETLRETLRWGLAR